MTVIGSASPVFLRPSNNNTQSQKDLVAIPLDVELMSSDDLEKVFFKWADMSPVERVREQYLKANGMTEKSLKAMPPEKREQIEREIVEMIKEKLRGEGAQSAGIVVDQTV